MPLVSVSIEQMKDMMERKEYIRFISIGGSVDHGKSTIHDGLVACASIVVSNESTGSDCPTTIPLKSACATLLYQQTNSLPLVHNPYLIYLLAFPSNCDFSPLNLSPIRICDGILLVVDFIEGINQQTECYIHKAMSERVQPSAMINKVDRALFELQLTGEEIYQCMLRSIEDFNKVIDRYGVNDMDWRVDPIKGNVIFGSGLQQWAFTLRSFAAFYTNKFNAPLERIVEKLWGDWVFITADGKSKWILSDSLTANGGVDKATGSKRAFVAFIMDPIIELCHAAMNHELTKTGVLRAHKMAEAIGVKLDEVEKSSLTGKNLFKRIMQKWIPLTPVVLNMFVVHLPSPIVAQRYRAAVVCEDSTSDAAGVEAVKLCDSDKPQIIHNCYVLPFGVRKVAIGRVYSGRLKSSQHHPAPVVSGQTTASQVEKVCAIMGKLLYPLTDVPAGNLCAVVMTTNQ